MHQCRQCGAAVAAEDLFCAECGLPLAGQAVVGAQVPVGRIIGAPAPGSPTRDWLTQNGFAEYVAAFEQQRIDLQLLPTLSDADLHALGMTPLGDRKRFMAAVERTRESLASEAAGQHVHRTLASPNEMQEPDPESALRGAGWLASRVIGFLCSAVSVAFPWLIAKSSATVSSAYGSFSSSSSASLAGIHTPEGVVVVVLSSLAFVLTLIVRHMAWPFLFSAVLIACSAIFALLRFSNALSAEITAAGPFETGVHGSAGVMAGVGVYLAIGGCVLAFIGSIPGRRKGRVPGKGAG